MLFKLNSFNTLPHCPRCICARQSWCSFLPGIPARPYCAIFSRTSSLTRPTRPNWSSGSAISGSYLFFNIGGIRQFLIMILCVLKRVFLHSNGKVCASAFGRGNPARRRASRGRGQWNISSPQLALQPKQSTRGKHSFPHALLQSQLKKFKHIQCFFSIDSAKFLLCHRGDAERVFQGDSGEQRFGPVVEEGHLQGDRTHGRHHTRVFQVHQMDGNPRVHNLIILFVCLFFFILYIYIYISTAVIWVYIFCCWRECNKYNFEILLFLYILYKFL